MSREEEEKENRYREREREQRRDKQKDRKPLGTVPGALGAENLPQHCEGQQAPRLGLQTVASVLQAQRDCPTRPPRPGKREHRVCQKGKEDMIKDDYEMLMSCRFMP